MASADSQSASSSNETPEDFDGKAKDEAFDEFYTEVKAIEKHDSVLTSKLQIDRLNRPGSTYFNLNPYDVLQCDPDTPLADIKKKFRQMSILVHPDKNPDDIERAQTAFDAVSKASKTLQNEEGLKRCREIIDEAKVRVDEITCKLFADLERLRIEKETKDMHERKRKAEEEEDEKERVATEKEWNKNFEESRTGRVDSWRQFAKQKKSSKKMKGTFRPPKPKLEKR
ncbi:DNJC8-like protein [Mya arenaria]|uniref:DNJC8-like protein n=1 Tax=Mya arenaria TaxID=6604 RepID=A0ABY7EIN3_MYAAR|nr:DNJC8-like protein [Mya arenaria]